MPAERSVPRKVAHQWTAIAITQGMISNGSEPQMDRSSVNHEHSATKANRRAVSGKAGRTVREGPGRRLPGLLDVIRNLPCTPTRHSCEFRRICRGTVRCSFREAGLAGYTNHVFRSGSSERFNSSLFSSTLRYSVLRPMPRIAAALRLLPSTRSRTWWI